MRSGFSRAAVIVAALCVGFALTASPIAAAPGGNGGGGGKGGTIGNGGNTNPPTAAATPELDSLMLLGSGVLGVAGYALLRRRAQRRPDQDSD